MVTAADTHGLTGCESNLTNNQQLVTVSASWSCADYIDSLHREVRKTSQRRDTLTIALPPVGVMFDERKPDPLLNFQQTGFERAARQYEEAARDEVYVAFAQTTETSRAEMLTRMVLSSNEQSNPGLLVKSFFWTR